MTDSGSELDCKSVRYNTKGVNWRRKGLKLKEQAT